MKIIFKYLLKALNFFTKRNFFYYKKNKNNSLGKTAVKSSLGFWYSGNVLDSQDLAYGILNNGVIEADGTELVNIILQKLLKDKENINFYDIGANTGYYGIMAAWIGRGKINTFSFEPVFEFNEVEQESLYLNKLENYCKIYNYAVGEENEEIIIHLSGTGSSLNKSFLDKMAYKERVVKKIKLDDFTVKEGVPAPDFIKIDVEGYENFVFAGSKKIISNYSPIIWFESARTLKARKYINSDFFANLDFLKSNGYSVFLTRDKALIRINRNYNKDGVEMFLAIKEIEHKGVFDHLLKNNFVVH